MNIKTKQDLYKLSCIAIFIVLIIQVRYSHINSTYKFISQQTNYGIYTTNDRNCMLAYIKTLDTNSCKQGNLMNQTTILSPCISL